jgi:hypothetical protein
MFSMLLVSLLRMASLAFFGVLLLPSSPLLLDVLLLAFVQCRVPDPKSCSKIGSRHLVSRFFNSGATVLYN